MARPIWNGSISFGLLNVPVQLYSGERTVDLHFRMLDSRDQSPVHYERVNTETGEEVPWKDVVKGFEYSKGNYVVVDEAALKRISPEGKEVVEIEAFVERAEIPPTYFEKPYYLVPGKKAEKGYVLLREVLSKTGKVGIAKVIIRTRQYLAALMPLDDALLLTLMRFPQELVPASEFTFPSGTASKYRVTPKEVDMASQLIESMSRPWKPADYKDDFRTKLHQLVKERVTKKGGKKTKTVEEPAAETSESTNVVDFMALLKKSLEKKGQSKDHPSSSSKKTAKRAKTTRRKVS